MKKLFLSLIVCILSVYSVFAISYGIDNYKVQVVVGKDAVHYINEDIEMNFYSAGHGFYREIPYSFSGSPVTAKITELSCSTRYSTEHEGGILSIKIGDPDKTVKGLQKYNIHYYYDLGIDTNSGYDEFYLDLLGDGWECNTSEFSYEVYLPKKDLNYDDVKVWITTGRYGSNSQLSYNVGENADYYVIYGTVNSIKAYQAVTIRVQLPDGWYVGAREPWDATSIFKLIAPYLSAAMVLIAFVLWVAFGKDRVPIITARFNAPEGFSPMVVGFLADGSVDDKDIIAMIFNWADRGLLTIEEKKKDQFTFTKTGEIELDVPKTERNLFEAFFKRCRVGDSVTLKDLQNNNFAEAMLRAKVGVTRFFTKDKALHSSKSRGLAVLVGFGIPIPMILLSAATCLTEYSIESFFFLAFASIIFTLCSLLSQWLLFRKWYVRKTNIAATIVSLIPLLVSFAFYNLFCSTVLSVICCTCSFILAFFAIIIDKKSEYGQKLFEEVLGYREFIDMVSMDELRMMIDKDPEIYYKVLSYAIVLGLEEKWSKKFSGIAVAAPSWYIGSNIVDVMYYSRMCSRMRSVIQLNSMAQVNTKGVGGGGFNMSGFAGGGFGGGGGRAW